MPVLCFGPVCVPLNLLLPFLLGILHHYGYFKWMKQEWVTFRYWHQRYKGWRAGDSMAATAAPAPTPAKDVSAAATDQQVKTSQVQQHSGQELADTCGKGADESEYEVVCTGDVCFLKPVIRKSLSMPGGWEASKTRMLRRTSQL